MVQVELRPNAFYELTNGCELAFADIECQYFIGPPLDLATDERRELEETNCEQTQAYGIVECEKETDEEAEENPLPAIGTVENQIKANLMNVHFLGHVWCVYYYKYVYLQRGRVWCVWGIVKVEKWKPRKPTRPKLTKRKKWNVNQLFRTI